MTAEMTGTLNQITAMLVQDQVELLHRAWDRLIDSGWQPELTDAHKAEFDRRLDDLDANPHNAVILEKLLEHVRSPR